MSNTPNPVLRKTDEMLREAPLQIDFQPEVALILGSGLGDFANDIRVTATLDYHDIEGFRFPLFRATRAVLSSATSAMCRLSACRAAFIIMKAIR